MSVTSSQYKPGDPITSSNAAAYHEWFKAQLAETDAPLARLAAWTDEEIEKNRIYLSVPEDVRSTLGAVRRLAPMLSTMPLPAEAALIVDVVIESLEALGRALGAPVTP